MRKFKPDHKELTDFDAFWEEAISDVKKNNLDVVFTLKGFGLKLFDTFDVQFNGYAGQPIKGWFIFPKDQDKPLPCVVESTGYGDGRRFPTDW